MYDVTLEMSIMIEVSYYDRMVGFRHPRDIGNLNFCDIRVECTISDRLICGLADMPPRGRPRGRGRGRVGDRGRARGASAAADGVPEVPALESPPRDAPEGPAEASSVAPAAAPPPPPPAAQAASVGPSGQAGIPAGLVESLQSIAAMFGTFVPLMQAQMAQAQAQAQPPPQAPPAQPAVQMDVPQGPPPVAADPPRAPRPDPAPQPAATPAAALLPLLPDSDSEQSAGVPVDRRRMTALSRLVREARSLGCESFTGEGDPQRAREWIEDISDLLGRMGLSDEDKLEVATLLLEKPAKTWWTRLRRQSIAPPTWSVFLTAFDAHFYTPYQHDRKREQFLELRQRGRTVEAYEREFTEIAALVPELIPSDRYLSTRFYHGLDQEIRDRMTFHRDPDFKTVFENALWVEESLGGRRTRSQSEKRKGTSGGRKHKKKARKDKQSGESSAPARDRAPPPPPSAPPARVTAHQDTSRARQPPRQCTRCGRAHFGQCRTPRCYACGEIGHIRPECPRRGGAGTAAYHTPGQASAPRGSQQRAPTATQTPAGRPPRHTDSAGPSTQRAQTRSQTRVFALTTEDAQTNPDVITGDPTTSR